MLAACWKSKLTLTLASLLHLPAVLHAYDLLEDFSGQTFFDKWDFYGNWDNLTLGDVWWLNRTQAFDQRLVYTNERGNAIIKVDNTSNVVYNEKRNTVRLTSQRTYDFGTIFIADIVHLPFGCSVWPALWTMGTNWPHDGEIDIIEGINLMTANQMALHTRPGCVLPAQSPPNQIGVSGERNCSAESGCTVFERKMFSYGANFAASGGGVWGMQFDVSGIFIWYWARGMIPPSVLNSNSTSSIPSIADWGNPSASFVSTQSCNITQFFGHQKLVLDITLCGIWASLPELYLPQCANSGPARVCYPDNVVGPGARYSNAYFEIPYIRTYTTQAAGAVPQTRATATAPAPAPTGTAASESDPNAGTGESAGMFDNAGVSLGRRGNGWGPVVFLWVVAIGLVL